MDKTSVAISVIVGIIVLSIGAHIIHVGSERYTDWREQSREWCADQNGDFKETVAGGKYSGLECTLESGKTVDMGEVADRDYPADARSIPSLQDMDHDAWPWGGLELKELIALFTLTLGITLSASAYRRYSGGEAA